MSGTFAASLMEGGGDSARRIPASTTPTPLPVAATVDLPESFTTEGGTRDTACFLDETGSTGLMVLSDGAVVYEHLRQGMRPDTRHRSFSVAKSVTSALVGIAIEEGLIETVEVPVIDYLPELAGTGFDGVTLEHVLEMSSGTDWQEDYGEGAASRIPEYSAAVAAGERVLDFLTTIGPDRPPGTFNGYSSMDAQVVGEVLNVALGDRTLSDYLHEKLWEPLGAQHDAAWSVDASGMEIALGGLHVSLSDYARFGQLFLQRGRWGDRQLIDARWVDHGTSVHAPHLAPGVNDVSLKPWGYGYLWWIPSTPMGGDYFASGIYNQYVYVNPEHRVVIANTAANERYPEDPEGYKLAFVDLFQAITRSLAA